MMCSRPASIVLVAALISLLIGVGNASGALPVRGAQTSAWRMLKLSADPAPNDLELLEIGFPRTAVRQLLSQRDLTLEVSSSFGDDYLAAAMVGTAPSHAPRALVLVVDRPSPPLDPVRVALRLRSSRVLGRPRVFSLTDPFSATHARLTPALCGLSLHGAASLPASGLGRLRTRGAALGGFSPTAAIAQAYDVACALPYEAAFVRSVTGQAPAPALPTPTPAPPAPSPPGCTPCSPAPGYACPLAFAAVCTAALDDGAKRAAVGYH